MQQISIVLIGFGNIGKAFARLILRKKEQLAVYQGIELQVTGIATLRHGTAINPSGIDLLHALELIENGDSLIPLSTHPSPVGIIDFISNCPGDVLLENSIVNHNTGEPAISHIRTALERGMHVITANKGPVAHAYHEINKLAGEKNRRFMFESAVMDGAPIFSLFRYPLPAIELRSFEGILNSSTNLIFERMEQGDGFDQAIAYAQSVGITEADPAADVDGWDAAIKIAALVTVLFGIPFKPQQVERQSIRGITPEMVAQALRAGERWKVICKAWRQGDQIRAYVIPQKVKPDSIYYSITGSSSYVQFETDVLPGLGIVEGNPGPETTAYGILADLINIYRNC